MQLKEEKDNQVKLKSLQQKLESSEEWLAEAMTLNDELQQQLSATQAQIAQLEIKNKELQSFLSHSLDQEKLATDKEELGDRDGGNERVVFEATETMHQSSEDITASIVVFKQAKLTKKAVKAGISFLEFFALNETLDSPEQPRRGSDTSSMSDISSLPLNLPTLEEGASALFETSSNYSNESTSVQAAAALHYDLEKKAEETKENEDEFEDKLKEFFQKCIDDEGGNMPDSEEADTRCTSMEMQKFLSMLFPCTFEAPPESTVCSESESDDDEDYDMDFLPKIPAPGNNVTYSLFTVRQERSTGDTDSRVRTGIKMLVRTSIHGYEWDRRRKQPRQIHTSLKLEHQPNLGAQMTSCSEITREWMALLIRPNTNLCRDPMYHLHLGYKHSSAESGPTSLVPYSPIDTQIATPYHIENKLIPAMKQNKKKANRNKKKKKLVAKMAPHKAGLKKQHSSSLHNKTQQKKTESSNNSEYSDASEIEVEPVVKMVAKIDVEKPPLKSHIVESESSVSSQISVGKMLDTEIIKIEDKTKQSHSPIGALKSAGSSEVFHFAAAPKVLDCKVSSVERNKVQRVTPVQSIHKLPQSTSPHIPGVTPKVLVKETFNKPTYPYQAKTNVDGPENSSLHHKLPQTVSMSRSNVRPKVLATKTASKSMNQHQAKSNVHPLSAATNISQMYSSDVKFKPLKTGVLLMPTSSETSIQGHKMTPISNKSLQKFKVAGSTAETQQYLSVKSEKHELPIQIKTEKFTEIKFLDLMQIEGGGAMQKNILQLSFFGVDRCTPTRTWENTTVALSPLSADVRELSDQSEWGGL
ncbi:hypothetical protein B566_EDAN012557 [Ephemera danica]|nr:hypothetical protein B566_EDAN012557 [Ephemera danica]